MSHHVNSSLDNDSIEHFVTGKANSHFSDDFSNYCYVSDETVKKLFRQLNKGVAPGLDEVTVEHLANGLYLKLCVIY